MKKAVIVLTVVVLLAGCTTFESVISAMSMRIPMRVRLSPEN